MKKWIHLCEQIVKKDDYFKELLPVLKNLDSNHNRAAIEWIATMRYGLKLSKLYPKDFLTIRYEDLVSNTNKELFSMENFIGLSNDKIFYNYANTVLKNKNNKKNFVLNEKVEELFQETMKSLNYTNI